MFLSFIDLGDQPLTGTVEVKLSSFIFTAHISVSPTETCESCAGNGIVVQFPVQGTLQVSTLLSFVIAKTSLLPLDTQV